MKKKGQKQICHWMQKNQNDEEKEYIVKMQGMVESQIGKQSKKKKEKEIKPSSSVVSGRQGNEYKNRKDEIRANT